MGWHTSDNKTVGAIQRHRRSRLDDGDWRVRRASQVVPVIKIKFVNCVEGGYSTAGRQCIPYVP